MADVTPPLRILFCEPRIPNNTGATMRLAAVTGAELHLARPLGFDMDDAKLRRAGVDYRDQAATFVHDSLSDAYAALLPARVFAFTSHADTNYTEIAYAPGDVLLFGPESRGLPAEILDGAYSFISLVYAGIGLFVFYQTQTNLIRALGDSKTPTVLLACGLTLNIIFEPIAILVFGWGIPGAALATLASQVCGNLLCLFFILRKVPALRTHRKDWCPDFKLYWEHLRIALPMGFQSSIIAIGAVIL